MKKDSKQAELVEAMPTSKRFLTAMKESLLSANLPALGEETDAFKLATDSVDEDASYLKGYFLLYFGIEGHVLVSNDYTLTTFDPYRTTILLIHIHNAARSCDLSVEVASPMKVAEDGSIVTLTPKQPDEAKEGELVD